MFDDFTLEVQSDEFASDYEDWLEFMELMNKEDTQMAS